MAINKYYRDLYYNDVLANSNDMKKTWYNINTIINKTRPSSQIDKLCINHKQIQHPNTISNTLNSYFCNISSTLASKIPKPKRRFLSDLNDAQSRFRFHEVRELEVYLLLVGLDKKKTLGIDKIDPLLLSIAAFEIYKPLTYIMNLSIYSGKFPNSLKIAKVIPIFKQGSRTLCNDYRPISILPALSKIFEMYVFNQLNFCLITNNLLVPNQFGFSPVKTTTDCLVH